MTPEVAHKLADYLVGELGDCVEKRAWAQAPDYPVLVALNGAGSVHFPDWFGGRVIVHSRSSQLGELVNPADPEFLSRVREALFCDA